MRDADDLHDLRREYVRLLKLYGPEATGFHSFRRSLLELNRRHRHEVARMYVKMIAKIERRLGGRN